MRRVLTLVWLGVLLRKLVGLVKRGAYWLSRDLPAAVKRLRVSSLDRLSAFQVHLVGNLLLGLTIAVLLHLVHESAYLAQVEDLAMDWATLMHRGTTPGGDPRPIAFIDIDETSYRAWGEPLLTPRDKLAALIKHAIGGDAAVVIVDIDLSRPDGENGRALEQVLESYADPSARGAELPPLVLVRTLRGQLPEHAGLLPSERETLLDSLVDTAPGIYWATAIFDLDLDGRVRRWRLWQAACDAEGTPVVYPSLQLQAKALLDGDDEQKRQLADALQALTPQSCAPSRQPDDAPEAIGAEAREVNPHGVRPTPSRDMQRRGGMSIALGDDIIDLQPHKAARRILYRIPWKLGNDEARPVVQLDGHQVPFLSVRSATTIADAVGPLDASWLAGHLVIIGASHLDSRDLYQTPVGRMPGALIVANAITSLDEHGELRTPSLLETLLIEAVLILAMSLLFARFDSFWGSLLSGAIVIGLLLPLSLWLFDSGYWLSFALPLLAIQLHQMAGELKVVASSCLERECKHD
ncbi:CHASE2 domain-containing protein [Thiorhodococcus minor]|uniref:CHASE2 domain-containing protein n=1 Tax=Thiorhodococcus minor TaxID=57489 RepID=A0A6M0JXB6_9GAMM|nr:CHASE2 domain-containing protein [Thiorhodococcus minor]NEV61611.1 CHASE2 domain-containing protein [Thiorhodococcus minor]